MKFLARINTQIYFMTFVAIVMLLPFVKNQFIVGSIINAVLLSSVMIFGIFHAIILSFIPSVVSLMAGLLPLSFTFMIPFIIISNILMVTAFGAFYRKSYFGGALLASFLKFFFLFGSVLLFLQAHSMEAEAKTLITMFGYLQLITAIIGSGIANLIRKFL